MLIESALLAGELLLAHACSCDNRRKRPQYLCDHNCVFCVQSEHTLTFLSHNVIKCASATKTDLANFPSLATITTAGNQPNPKQQIRDAVFRRPFLRARTCQHRLPPHPTAFIFFRHLHYPLGSTPRCSHHLYPYWGPLGLFGPTSLPITM